MRKFNLAPRGMGVIERMPARIMEGIRESDSIEYFEDVEADNKNACRDHQDYGCEKYPNADKYSFEFFSCYYFRCRKRD